MINSNEYFDGNVKSLGYETNAGPSTVGVMNPGTYDFSTSQHETITVIEGELQVQLPSTSDWIKCPAGTKFEVEANKTFTVKAVGQTAYLCLYR